MGGQAGIYQYDRRPIDVMRIECIRKSLEVNGFQVRMAHPDSSVAIGWRLNDLTGGDVSERESVPSQQGNVITFDGRLDNREDVMDRLQNDLHESGSDAQLALATYCKWGITGLRYLIGDWAIVIWDPSERAVYLARDFSGARPLQYQITSAGVVWSSEMNTFINGSPEFCDEYLVRYLALFPHTDMTPYKGVKSVPTGKYVRCGCSYAEAQGVVWEPDLHASILYNRDEDYEEHFKTLFRSAIKSRLRTSGAAWAELSGGLDSSSIVCTADELIAEGQTHAKRLETITYIFDQSKSSDERSYSDLVKRPKELRHYLNEDEYETFSYGDQNQPERPHNCPGRPCTVARLIEKSGARVLLSGQGGDSVMWYVKRPYLELADLVARRHFRELRHNLRAYAADNKLSQWDLLWHDAIKPALLRRTVMDGRIWHFERWMKNQRWMSKEILERHLPLARQEEHDDRRIYRGVLEGSRNLHKLILDHMKVLSLHIFRRGGRIHATYPYFDRRIVQFMLAIPHRQRGCAGMTRNLHRRAMTGILPEEIRQRKTKAGGDEPVCRAIVREWDTIQDLMNERAIVVEREYVNPKAFRSALESARLGYAPDLIYLTRAISLELWLQVVSRN